jgi:hypothetical protein
VAKQGVELLPSSPRLRHPSNSLYSGRSRRTGQITRGRIWLHGPAVVGNAHPRKSEKLAPPPPDILAPPPPLEMPAQHGDAASSPPNTGEANNVLATSHIEVCVSTMRCCVCQEGDGWALCMARG